VDTHTNTYSTNFAELSPSWEADGCSPSQEISIFYGTQIFITVFTRALHCSVSWASSIQSTLSHSISLRSVSLPSFHLDLGLPSGLYSSFFFQIEIFYAFYYFSIPATCPSHLVLIDLMMAVKLVMSTSYEAPHYVVLSNLPLLHISYVQIFPSGPCSQARSGMFFV
jgi:hypothetical protein